MGTKNPGFHPNPGRWPGLVERPFQGRKPIMGTGNGRLFRPEGPVLLAQVEGLGIGVGPPGMGYSGLKGRFC